jgi:uncharacterized membrane protein
MRNQDMERLEHSIEVDAPVRVVYNQWTQFEEFPRFMEGVERVEQLDDKRIRWVAKIGGKEKDWTAEITRQVPDREIDWMGFGGAENLGRLMFEPIEDDRTKVTLLLDYEPEGAVEEIGDALGVTKRRVKGDMERFEEFIEARGRETGGWRGEIHGDEVTRRTG